MKIHFFISGFTHGTMDLDKKLPHLVKLYPDGEIEKTTGYNSDCIKGTNIVQNIDLIELLGEKMESKVNIDFHGFSNMCFSCFDISFDLELPLAKKLVDTKNHQKSLLMDKTHVMIDGKSSSFGVLLTQHILPYYDVENSIKIDKSLDDEVSALNKNLDIILEKTAMRPYSIISTIGGMSVGTHNNCLIIEDYQNELDTSNDSWENIMVDDDSIYLNKEKSILVCKNKSYYDDCCIYHMHCRAKSYTLKYSNQTAIMFLNTIKKQGEDIKKNIIDDNRNSYYWKDLKKNIEVLDLNFLEFYLDMINMTKIDFDDLFSNWNTTSISERHRDECENHIVKVIDNLLLSLNEIKYGISNILTPIHANDEAILQKETEKVNDRILMLSFIAMVVSAIGMIQSDEIDIGLKIISGTLIFSLPILYYIIRGFQKKISLRKNQRSELTRRLDISIKGLEQAKKEHDSLKNEKDLPEDFKAEAVKFMHQFIAAEEAQVEKLKKKIK